MRNIFLIILLFTFAYAGLDTLGKKREKFNYDKDNTFKDDDNKKMEFDKDSTFDEDNSSDSKKEEEKEINVREVMPKKKEEVEALQEKKQQLEELLSEAESYKNEKLTSEIQEKIDCFKTLEDYHTDKDVTDDDLLKAYKTLKSFNSIVSKLKTKLKFAKLNTPEAKKIRKFKRYAKIYLRKAKTADKQNKVAEAQYYKTLSKIKAKAAKEYRDNPEIENTSKEEMKKARVKFKSAEAKESADRYRKRAEKALKKDDKTKADYYKKLAQLKDKISAAYAKNDTAELKKAFAEFQKAKGASKVKKKKKINIYDI